jgi:glycosyltransferase involved in cell wall biosynthesis
MRVSLVTLGDPDTMTGGYLYHRRLADMAPQHDAEISFVSFPDITFPLPTVTRRHVAGEAAAADVVVVDSIALAFWGRGRAGGRPVVAMAHQPPGGIDHGRARTRIQSVQDRRAYDALERIMVASADLAAQMRARGVDGAKIVVVPPGRDVADPDPELRDLRQGRGVAILGVGNWVKRKGIVDLVDAFALLRPNDATLHLVGDTEAEPGYAKRVRERLADPSVGGRVRVHGIQPPEVVAALYRDADVFALPSAREPYGTVYGEAMAFGLPVVGYDAGNLPHLARDGQEGLIVPPGDVLALREALARLVADRDLRERLGEGARRRAETFPTWNDTARLFFATLRSLNPSARGG